MATTTRTTLAGTAVTIRKVLATCALVVLALAVTAAIYPRRTAVGGATDFTTDSACEGAWLIFTDGTETAAETNRCDNGDQDAVVQGGATFTATAPPAGSKALQDAVQFDDLNNSDFTLADGSGEADEFEVADFTFGCWGFINTNNALGVVMAKGETQNWQMYVQTTPSIVGTVKGTDEGGSSTITKENSWGHFALRYDSVSTDTVEIFYNGLTACSGACASQTTAPTGNTTHVIIGAQTTTSFTWDGDLMECFYLSKAIADTELAEIILCGFDGTADGDTRDSNYGLDSCTSSGTPWLCCTGSKTGTCIGCGDITTCC